MDDLKFSSLKKEVQDIIDSLATADYQTANLKLIEAAAYLDELLDFSEADEELIEISKYQVLLNQLHQRIQAGLQK
jgi:hypothetical protein